MNEGKMTIGDTTSGVATNRTPTELSAPNQRDLAEIAADIIAEKDRVAQSFIGIGKLLIEAKEQLTKHGEWLKWLSGKVDIPARTAERFMQLTKAYSNSPALANLGMTKAEALLALLAAQREDFINTPHKVHGEQKQVSEMSSRELKQVIRETIKPPEEANTSSNPLVSFKILSIQKYLSDVKEAQMYLNRLQKFLEKDKAVLSTAKHYRKNICSLVEVAQKCLSLIDSELNQNADQE